MPRARSPKRDEAYKMWLDSGGKKKLKDIASDLGVSETQIRKWKNLDKWNGNVTNQSKGNVTKRKRGAQPGNHNATGPPGNKNAEKYGFFSKYLPEETVSIIQEMPTDPLDILWHEIQIAYAAIIRAQQIMYVKDKSDKTIEKVEKKDGNVIGEKWEVQQAWDKHANFLKAQARAMSDLRGSIRQYDELLHKRWDLATDEQKARIEQMKANTDRLKRDSSEDEEDGVEIINDAEEKETDTRANYQIVADAYGSVVVLRKHHNKLRKTVYKEMLRGINRLKIPKNRFNITKSPMEITYKKYGTTIYFSGSDGIDDTKGIIDEDKPIKLVILDELTEFFDDGEGEDELTNIEATFVRGNSSGFQMIYLYNPPKNPNAPINQWC